MEVKQRVLGTEHPVVALKLGNRALCLTQRGRMEEAQALHTRARGLVSGLDAQHPLGRMFGEQAAALQDQGLPLHP